MTSAQHERFMIDGNPVEVTRKRIKNLHLRVAPPEGRVVVSAPFELTDEEIQSFVQSRSEWIRHQRRIIDEEVAEWRALVKILVPSLVSRWEPVMGVHAGKLVYRNMKSRWGSCQPSTGRICINVRLALYPPVCLEYVVVHELCHLLEPSHGVRFKRLMDTFLPQWREAERILNPR